MCRQESSITTLQVLARDMVGRVCSLLQGNMWSVKQTTKQYELQSTSYVSLA